MSVPSLQGAPTTQELRKPPTAQEKKLGMIVFTGLIVAGLLVNYAWKYSGTVAPPVVSAGSISFEGVYLSAVADHGDADAMFLLAESYIAGLTVPKDLVEAQKWCRLAVSRESTRILNARQLRIRQSPDGVLLANFLARSCNSLPQSMTPQQLADAEKRASEWLAAFEKRKE